MKSWLYKIEIAVVLAAVGVMTTPMPLEIHEIVATAIRVAASVLLLPMLVLITLRSVLADLVREAVAKAVRGSILAVEEERADRRLRAFLPPPLPLRDHDGPATPPHGFRSRIPQQ